MQPLYDVHYLDLARPKRYAPLTAKRIPEGYHDPPARLHLQSRDGNAVVCSDNARAYADFGDSGVRVFKWVAVMPIDKYVAMGILFGLREVVPGQRTFVMSRWAQIESDLGSLAQ